MKQSSLLKRFSAGLVAVATLVSLAACGSGSSSADYRVTAETATPDLISKNSPIASAWLPDAFLKWSPRTDKDLAYNKSTVPLAKRIPVADLPKVNKTQNRRTKVVALMGMNTSTSGNPSRGTQTFGGNSNSKQIPFDYWQYVDTLVYWAGSVSEGIIVPPSADVIDEAHLNGVPVLGNIFLPDNTQWSDSNDYQAPVGLDATQTPLALALIKQDADGSFPFAKQLVAVAKDYGFDGWFINQETSGLTADQAMRFKQLIQAIHRLDPKLEIMWYDAMAKDAVYDNYWQGKLDDENLTFLDADAAGRPADAMFIDFRWDKAKYGAADNPLKASAEYAKAHGIDPYSLYAGVEMEQTDSTPQINLVGNWPLVSASADATYTSLGLFRPDSAWMNANGFFQYQSLEQALWVNSAGDPRKSLAPQNGQNIPGVSHYVVERSAITGSNFSTDFSLGNGYSYFKDGRKISNRDWNDRSLAQVLPTYRWIIDNEGGNRVIPSIDYSTAYAGGNSLKFVSSLGAGKRSTVSLFTADLKFGDSTKFTVAAKAASAVDLAAVLTLADGSKATLKGDRQAGSDWGLVNFDTAAVKGKTVKNISLQFSADSALAADAINIGQLTVSDGRGQGDVSVSGLKTAGTAFEEDGFLGGIRLTWQAASAKDLRDYEVYQVNADGSQSFLGASAINDFFVNALPRDKNSDVTSFRVVPVSNSGQDGRSADVRVTWPPLVPKADFAATATVVAPGSKVSFINKSNLASTKFKWSFPGADTTSSTAKDPAVTYSKEGTYSVSLTATTDKGKSQTKTQQGLIIVTKAASAGLTDYALNKPVTVDSFTNDKESGPHAVDGDVKTKWCANSASQHSIVIDLGAPTDINAVSIDHAQAGGEDASMNTAAYTIAVSPDGQDWQQVVNVAGNKAAKTTDAFKQVSARYVKLVALKPTQGGDTAVRWYEIEVLGLKK